MDTTHHCNSASILVVDDDEIILLAIKETLAPEGYRIVTTTEASKGIELAKEVPFAVIISDQRMPEMMGLDFFSQVKKIQPASSRILITGVLTLKTLMGAVNKAEVFRFLPKPWVREDLLLTVKTAVQRYELFQANEKLREDALRFNEELSDANRCLQEQLTFLKQKNEEMAVSCEVQ
ncbi:MAG: hypothetical protein A2Y14_01630 [Verrucomicrobia bacterium GWF2_51_19]|nr:MAG: hypothetical protein A2Y14_01630 [Verrucomicrobia bacterium GWF2_51_19]HCJ11560.1 hypothetical protein [Opitutae bacterium]